MSITVEYKKTSPYFKTPLIDKKFLDILTYRSIPAEADDLLRQIGPTYQYRPDLMSFDLYGTVDFWWVFIIRNRDTIIDPIWDFKADTKIYIPKLETIRRSLGV